MEAVSEFKRVAQNFVNEYHIDSQNEQVIHCLIDYFTQNKRFETYHETFSLRKGLLLVGPCGTGKTMTLRIFQRWLLEQKKQTFAMWHINEINEDYQKDGSLSRFSRAKDIAIDEIGLSKKETVKRWGNSSNLIEDLVTNRYYLFSTLGTLTHFTTNLTTEQIKNSYSDRVWGRLNEICNIIKIVSEDRRMKSKPLERKSETLKTYYQTPEERFHENISFIINHIRNSKIAGEYLPCGVFDGLAWLYYDYINEIKLVEFSKSDKIKAFQEAETILKTEKLSNMEKLSTNQDRQITIAKGLLFKDFVMSRDSLQIIEKFLETQNKYDIWEQIFPE